MFKVRHLFAEESMEVLKLEVLWQICNSEVEVLLLICLERFFDLILRGHYMLVDYRLPLQRFVFF